ncbi:hypothetical protein QOZ80_9AG0678970 [Eleusine coracana subsp. coracana]|nr:hypothetical protein QOZ80_9AG0678970 [Eleusine coracana subsp. coracana]
MLMMYVMFLRPDAHDIGITMDLLQLFGDASGLKTNVQKSSAYPIQCRQEDIEVIQSSLPCAVSEFPCKYLGLPLSLKKLTKNQVRQIIDRIADLLPGWKSELMNKAGRAVHVQFVMTVTLIYSLMAIDLPQWALKEVDKHRRGYLWRGRKEAKGGHCLVAWGQSNSTKGVGRLENLRPAKLGDSTAGKMALATKNGPQSPLEHVANSSARTSQSFLLRCYGIRSWRWNEYFVLGRSVATWITHS